MSRQHNTREMYRFLSYLLNELLSPLRPVKKKTVIQIESTKKKKKNVKSTQKSSTVEQSSSDPEFKRRSIFFRLRHQFAIAIEEWG